MMDSTLIFWSCHDARVRSDPIYLCRELIEYDIITRRYISRELELFSVRVFFIYDLEYDIFDILTSLKAPDPAAPLLSCFSAPCGQI